MVAKNVEPYSIYCGNPARLIKYRFSESEIERLLELKWWDWSANDIVDSMTILLSSNIELLYEQYKKRNRL